jgi:hypothetical protein
MRRMGFWIEDYAAAGEAFVASDLDTLIQRGTITVIDEPS